MKWVISVATSEEALPNLVGHNYHNFVSGKCINLCQRWGIYH